MSLKVWCPDCVTQTVLGVMSIADGDEFICDDCKRVFLVRIERGLTPRALDECACGNPKSSESPCCAECIQDKKEALASNA